jgi:hypothetical protein
MFGVNDNHNDNNQGQPVDNNQPVDSNSPAPANPISEPHNPVSAPTPVDSSTVANPTPAEHPDSAPEGSDDLLKLKQDALKDLEPMVDKLDQTPTEKFKTVMMLIQASDNSSLVKEAYETAKKITDEKERAQALIDVINEINYFTQKP